MIIPRVMVVVREKPSGIIGKNASNDFFLNTLKPEFISGNWQVYL